MVHGRREKAISRGDIDPATDRERQYLIDHRSQSEEQAERHELLQVG